MSADTTAPPRTAEAARGGPGHRGWFLHDIPADAELVLYGFPYTGTGASSYRAWPSRIGDAHVCPLQPPGRESRIREEPHRTHADFADDLVEVLAEHARVPYVLVGHCGAVPYLLETALRLDRAGVPLPLRVIASSWGAPHRTLYGRLNFVDLEAFDATAEVTANFEQMGRPVAPDLVELAAETLVLDLEIQRPYRYDPSVRLPCPVTVIGWTGDEVVPDSVVHEGWEECADTTHRVLEGDHLDFLRCPPVLRHTIAKELHG